MEKEEESNRKPEAGVKEGCDGEKKRNVPPELLLLIFSVQHLLCVGVSCWFKAPVKRRICKGLQATRRHASRVTTQQPPLLLTTLYWLPQSLSTPSDLRLSLFIISSLLPPSFTLTRPGLCDYLHWLALYLLFRSFFITTVCFNTLSPIFSLLLLISSLWVPALLLLLEVSSKDTKTWLQPCRLSRVSGIIYNIWGAFFAYPQQHGCDCFFSVMSLGNPSFSNIINK